MNDSQKIGMLARQLKEALDCLDLFARWDLDEDGAPASAVQALARRARFTLKRIRGGDGRPPPIPQPIAWGPGTPRQVIEALNAEGPPKPSKRTI